ncbi:hypothetical protein AAE478_003401 [Parahypoxylon ruwenzoriense]
MAPIQVYTDSPIAALKPSGSTPQTAQSSSTVKPPTSSASPTSPRLASYPPARPGAVPFLPGPTGTAQSYIPPQPTRTFNYDGPPPPQPGASPVPPGAATKTIPPPPKAGEKYQLPQQTLAPQAVSMPYPQQMPIPAPTAPYPSQQRGTSTALEPTTAHGSQDPAALRRPTTYSLEHPPGYHQNANASELDRYQRSAVQHSELEQTDDSGSVWGTAKKWAQQTGERLAAAENEVWKKINKE